MPAYLCSIFLFSMAWWTCVSGTCVTKGISYANGTVWQPSACSVCTCYSPVPFCEVVQCQPYVCNFTKGEYLSVPPGRCCPQCYPAPRQCTLNGKPVPHNTEWSPRACLKCLCIDGAVSCHNASCSINKCPPGQTRQQLPGKCCPQCLPTGRSCIHQGRTFIDGSQWAPLPCTRCMCHNGQTTCLVTKCQPQVCKQEEKLEVSPGGCCPYCRAAVCKDGRKEYQSGSTWKRDRCTHCVCISGKIKCHRQTCEVTCAAGEVQRAKPNQCCPLCYKNQAPCLHKGVWKYSGDVWNTSRCEVCQCQAGRVQCHRLQCHPAHCPQGEVVVREKDQCCPRCMAVPECHHRGHKYKSGESWVPSQCELCVCKGGMVRCYMQPCPVCPKGFHRMAVPGQCCGICQHVQCAKQCKTCEPGQPDHCTTCRVTGKLQQGGKCQDKCSAGYFTRKGLQVCKACHSRCNSCFGDTSHHCQTCHKGELLQNGQCVKNCSPRHYQHNFKCLPCYKTCARCKGPRRHDCMSCLNPLEPPRGGQCRLPCGRGQHWIRRACRANREAPFLLKTNYVSGNTSTPITITTEMLGAGDPDSLVADLTYYIIRSPTNGRLLKAVSGLDQMIGKGGSFSMMDLQAGRIRVIYDHTRLLTGSMELWVSDGYHSSQRQTLPVIFTSPMPPFIIHNEPLHLEQGSRANISVTHLALGDQDSFGAVVVTILQGPKHGQVVKGSAGNQIHMFRASDLGKGGLSYVHSGNEAEYDNMVLQAKDGSSQVITFLFSIHIMKKGSKEPVMMSLKPVTVTTGQMVQLSKDFLEASVVQGSSSDLIYSLTPPTSNPKGGELMMVVPLPAAGVSKGWQHLGSDLMGASIVRFRQRDIDEGRIWYRHHGDKQATDYFVFEVSDGGKPANILKDQEFHINVMKLQKDSSQGGRELGAAPSVAPGVRLGMTVLENQLVPITSSDLAFVDVDTDNQNIIYHVTQPLLREHGTLEHLSRPFTPVRKFTQEDINRGLIIYRPPMVELGHQRKEFSFKFTVQDGQGGPKLQENKFTIHVMPVNNVPPRLLNPTPVVQVPQGGSVTLGKEVLGVTDPDTSLDDIEFTLKQAAVAGSVIKRQNGFRAELRPGDKFMYSEVLSSAFFYMHDGSNVLADNIFVTISDGKQTQEANVKVEVIKVDKAAPTLAQSAAMTLTLQEGETAEIGPQLMAFLDADSDVDSIRLTVVTPPEHGHLLLGNQILQQGSTFTQTNINGKLISFAAEQEIGSKPVTDVLCFNVSDSAGNVLPLQLFTIIIQPSNSQPPVVTVADNVQVEEGGRVVLTIRDISATDVDTPVGQLVVVAKSQPRFGVLEKTTTGGRGTQHQVVTAFTFQDVLKGRIHYVQAHHQGKEPTADGFLFQVSDGNNLSPIQRLNISIVLKNDEPPEAITETIRVQENKGVLINNASLYILDLDTSPAEITLSLQAGPQYGNLGKKELSQDSFFTATRLQQGDTFTYQDVLDELLVYTHEGQETQSDKFLLSITDGRFTGTKEMKVAIGLINDETPRMQINVGLRVKPGSTTTITPQILKATDLDSVDRTLRYTITQLPRLGRLVRTKPGATYNLTATRRKNTFTQSDIDRGFVKYVHSALEHGGMTRFKFSVEDLDGNKLIDQVFIITVLDDRVPPNVLVNKELTVREGGAQRITTDYLSATDTDSEPGDLVYHLVRAPVLGHLAMTRNPATPVGTFKQTDIAANSLMYVHTSQRENYMDSFTFSVSDGTNEVTETFYINISPVDDALPVVVYSGLRVQEGVRKIITEFDLKATDADTKEDKVEFKVLQMPIHGKLEKKIGKIYVPATKFKMAAIYNNKISYKHDGSDTTKDGFSFTVTDGTNAQFKVRGPDGETLTSQPQEFNIEVVPVDDGSPIVDTNLGLQYLQQVDGKSMKVITDRELKSVDSDTPSRLLAYSVTSTPQHGRLEHLRSPGVAILRFTQEDVNRGLVRYVLTGNMSAAMDQFTFTVLDSKPNTVPGNVFYITWSVVSFQVPVFNYSEAAGVVKVPIHRAGNLKQYSVVTCQTRAGTAHPAMDGSSMDKKDYMHHVGQVQFEEWQDMKTCNIRVLDDSIFEGPETFYVELTQPTYALVGEPSKATIAIQDADDEAVVEFEKNVYAVNETDGSVMLNIVRKGDLMGSVSVICYTQSLTAMGTIPGRVQSGADYLTRPNHDRHRVTFSPGVKDTVCQVKLLDDSLFEGTEQFEVILSSPSPMCKVGKKNKALVMIEGPNDVATFYLSAPVYYFDEDTGQVEIPVLRQGSDISHSSVVWCGTKTSDPVSALPGEDYTPHTHRLSFGPGQVSQMCTLKILDDEADPHLEGNETFIVYLNSAVGSGLVDPHSALVFINDTNLDMTRLHFESPKYRVAETDRVIHVPVVRSGDARCGVSVVCYTRQQSAKVMMDYQERVYTQASKILFKPGEKVKNCTVGIVDDVEFEEEENFLLKLAWASMTKACSGPATIGTIDTTAITITNTEDEPTLQFEKAAYSVAEPESASDLAEVIVRVKRTGEKNRTATVRCSTRDGSAVSGIDYDANSQVLHFKPGQEFVEFSVDVLPNEAVEWHETFSVVLGPGQPSNAVLGHITIATITILDHQVSGSVVLPAAPVVVSLLDYDDVKKGSKLQPSPGYPLACVTPCDKHFPTYTVTRTLCENTGINQSAILFKWEVALPAEGQGSRPLFTQVDDHTLFTRVDQMVLDSIYFRPKFQVRCVAQPVHKSGNLGVPLKSAPVTIGTQNGICLTPVTAGNPHGLSAQSFIAKLKYLDPSDKDHPNTIHISVLVPHQDGMLPLVSTLPLHNIQFLLTELAYRQLHVCSNMVSGTNSVKGRQGFLEANPKEAVYYGRGEIRPYQFDAKLRGNKTVNLYHHLNLKTCTWKFDAWYHMTELVDACGGSVISDFQVRDAAKSYLTIEVPLYVSYIYPTAPSGWATLDHRTEMHFSFYYDAVHWKAGLETNGEVGGTLQVLRISAAKNGNLVIEFKSQTRFRGIFVIEHKSMPGFKSRILPPEELALTLDLDLVWSQQTFDSPSQLWSATSRYNLKDYSGEYTVELIPCSVTSTQPYTSADLALRVCTAHQPLRFTIPITFQQTNRPVPLVYSLDTQFHVTVNEKVFLSDPSVDDSYLDDMEYDEVFSKGQTIYGRVLWNPEQDLKTAYKLRIEKLFICTGKDGYVPNYDPTGDTYGKGQQFGCLQNLHKLKHRFLVLDRGSPSSVDRGFSGVEFNAKFASDDHRYRPLNDLPGVDGFAMQVDPLYKVDAGHQWYLQVIYIIGPAGGPHQRYQRSVLVESLPGGSTGDIHRHHSGARFTRDIEQGDIPALDTFVQYRNGTNIHSLTLNASQLTVKAARRRKHGDPSVFVTVVVPVLVFTVTLVLISFCILFLVRRRKRRRKEAERQAECSTTETSESNVTVCVHVKGANNGASIQTDLIKGSKRDEERTQSHNVTSLDRRRKGKDDGAGLSVFKSTLHTRPTSGTEV